MAPRITGARALDVRVVPAAPGHCAAMRPESLAEHALPGGPAWRA